MARGINKVILVGNLGSDPEVRYTPSGTAVANFNLATNEAFKDKEGVLQEKTEWHRIVVWDRLAEICEKYLKKGSQIYIEGSLQTRQYEDKEGVTKYTTEIKAREMQILGSREGGGRDDIDYDEKPRSSGGGGQSRESRGGYSGGGGGGGSRGGSGGGQSGGGARSGGSGGGQSGPWDDGGSRGGASRSGGSAPARGRTVEPDSSFDPAGDDDLPF